MSDGPLFEVRYLRGDRVRELHEAQEGAVGHYVQVRGWLVGVVCSHDKGVLHPEPGSCLKRY